ncbi:MAG: hypothetical protein Q9191_007259, partial [Dirinaria sp. TL-2023a]
MSSPYTVRWGILGKVSFLRISIRTSNCSNEPNPHHHRFPITRTNSHLSATGGIAVTFTKDLMLDPSTRGVHDIAHTVTAAASSTSSQRAREFLTECHCPSSASAYGSYEELVHDPNVDIIYVATPHSHHYQNTMLCLLAGKPVLCEKAFTVNAAQTEKLISVAKEKNLFLMEAVWTRFFPLSIQIRSLIERGE